jgi:hypothetical protein
MSAGAIAILIIKRAIALLIIKRDRSSELLERAIDLF